MFSKEVRKSTVGIIGLGKIGFTAAQIFNGVGARVIGYDVVEKDYLGDVCEQVDLETLLAESDIISMHMPYFKGSNDEFLNAEKIAKMKLAAEECKSNFFYSEIAKRAIEERGDE